MLTIDDVVAAKIELYRDSDGTIKFRGPEGSRDKLNAVMKERCQLVMNAARGDKVRYHHAKIAKGAVPMGTLGKCELCEGEIAHYESGTCLLCARVVMKTMDMDRTARLHIMDTETTGLDPHYCGVIEVGLITLDRSLKEIGRYESKMPVRDEFMFDSRAYEKNGYTPERWQDARSHEEVYAELRSRIRPHDLILGWNIAFDIRMLAATARRLRIDWPPLARDLDVRTIATRLLKGKMPASTKLTNVTSFLNIEHIGAHAAMPDVEATVAVYRWCVEQLAPKVAEQLA